MFIFSLLPRVTLEKRPISESTLPDYGLHAPVPGHHCTQGFPCFTNEFNIILNNCLADRNLMDIAIAYAFYYIIYNVVAMAA